MLFAFLNAKHFLSCIALLWLSISFPHDHYNRNIPHTFSQRVVDIGRRGAYDLRRGRRSQSFRRSVEFEGGRKSSERRRLVCIPISTHPPNPIGLTTLTSPHLYLQSEHSTTSGPVSRPDDFDCSSLPRGTAMLVVHAPLEK